MFLIAFTQHVQDWSISPQIASVHVYHVGMMDHIGVLGWKGKIVRVKYCFYVLRGQGRLEHGSRHHKHDGLAQRRRRTG